MAQPHIGSWVRRVKRIRIEDERDVLQKITKWHYTDSVIAGAAVTTCGRRLEPHIASRPDTELEVSDVKPLTRMIGQPQLCDPCDGEDG